jgi:hypothetical protein
MSGRGEPWCDDNDIGVSLSGRARKELSPDAVTLGHGLGAGKKRATQGPSDSLQRTGHGPVSKFMTLYIIIVGYVLCLNECNVICIRQDHLFLLTSFGHQCLLPII